MEDLRHLEFFAINSKEIVEKQVDSYRQQNNYRDIYNGSINYQHFSMYSQRFSDPVTILFPPGWHPKWYSLYCLQ